jgi:hypothetical protein
MTFASRMQHRIYWGPLKKPVEWSLKTVLAPWAYMASVVYHDSFWYPVKAKRMMRQVLGSPWGQLFRRGRATPTALSAGRRRLGALRLTGGQALVRSSASSAPASPRLPNSSAAGRGRGGIAGTPSERDM